MSRRDVRCTDQERPTSNVQLSTFNGVTESAHGGQNMGTDTELWRQVSLGCSWRYCCVPIRSVSIFFWGREPGRRRRSRRRYFPARRRRDFRSMGVAPRLCASGNFGSGDAGLGNMRADEGWEFNAD